MNGNKIPGSVRLNRLSFSQTGKSKVRIAFCLSFLLSMSINVVLQ